MSSPSSRKVAILWRGNREARQLATPSNNRFHRIFEELQKLGIEAEPAVYGDDFADEVRAQLLQVDAVLVWANPIHEGKTRERLNEMLRDVASRGPWVSAHPDTILKMGTKEVVFRTRHMGWGTETRLYTSFAEFRETFPAQLRPSAPRVLKQNRGNDGEGVWKIDLLTAHGPEALVRVCQALAGSEPCETPLDAFLASCEPYFSQGGKILDQPFQARLRDGMIRCYVGENRVVGFGHQYPKGLMPPDQMHPDAGQGKVMHPADALRFQALRRLMDEHWIPELMAILGLDAKQMPIIWDADFLYGPRAETGEDTYILCEINVSSVFAIPDQAPAAIARLTANRLAVGAG